MRTSKRPAARKARRGRPPRLSREQIVAASAEFLRDHPHEALTLASAASAAGASPMAIYRYVADREDLRTAVLEHVLDELSHPSAPDAAWQDQVRAWMTSVHDHLLQFPQCLPLLATKSGTSPAWLRSVSVLAEILERSGLSGERLFEAVYWVSMATMGYVQLALAQPPREQARGLKAGLKELSGDAVPPLRRIARHADGLLRRALEVVIERTLAGVEDLRAR